MDLPVLHVSCKWSHAVFCDWLLSLKMMFSKFTRVVACVGTSFLLLAKNIPFIFIMYPLLS